MRTELLPELPKRVLLTGAGGAIGVHVIAHIMHNTNWHVVALDSFHHKGYKDRLRRVVRNHPEWKSRITEIQHDLTCPIGKELAQEIGYPQYILHLAALSDVFYSIKNPVWVIQNNINSTLMLAEFAKESKPDVFLYFSTDEVYGPVTRGEAHKEWSTHRPSNAYAASKAACEDILYAYWRGGDINGLVITNTMNNFGEMQAPSKFPAMIQQKLERGEEILIHGNEQEIGSRFYIHSRNSADALLYILQNLAPHHHVTGQIDEPDRYHIVGDTNYTNLELAQVIAKLMGKELKYRLLDFHKDNPAHDIHYGLQDNKLRPGGWQQPVSTEDSLANTIAWQQRNPEWMAAE